jgi:hypothetical protein
MVQRFCFREKLMLGKGEQNSGSAAGWGGLENNVTSDSRDQSIDGLRALSSVTKKASTPRLSVC